MWIILRLAFALAVTLGRYFWPRSSGGESHESRGHLRYTVRHTRNKNKITGTFYGLPCANPMFLRLTPERSADRLFKALGFSRELQTGDAIFDRTVYVACDHPGLAPALQSDAAIRDAVRATFATGVTKIFTDGKHLWAYRNGAHLPDEFALNNLDALRTALDGIPVTHWASLGDPFFWRVLAVESLAWGAAAYGVPGLIELGARSHPLYFEWMPVIWTGLAVAAVLFAALLAVIRSFLGGSSRGHRIIVESAIVLALGLPLTGVELTSDANRYFDSSPVETLRPTIASKFERVTRKRRGRTSTTYFVQLDTRNDPQARALLQPTMRVDRSTYAMAQPGAVFHVDFRRGALGFPWIESVGTP